MRRFATGLLALWFAGCAGPKGSDPSNPAVMVQTARFLDIQQNRLIPVSSFSNRERFAVAIKNLTSRDQVLQVELVRQDSGVTFWRNAVTVARGRIHVTGPTTPVGAGSYTVKVSGTGMQPAFHPFTVYGY